MNQNSNQAYSILQKPINQTTKKMSNTAEKRKELIQAFISAKSIQESLESFKKMDESELFQESELGLLCLPLTNKLHFHGNDSQKVLSFGKRDLESLNSKQNSNNIRVSCTESSSHFHPVTFAIAKVSNLLGFACLDLKRYNEGLSHYNLADKYLSELGKKGTNSCPGNCILQNVECCQLGLFEVNKAIGKTEEAVTNMRKVLEIREKMLDKGCMEIGEAYKGLYVAYLVTAVDFKQALPFCLKALEIYRKHLGCDSVEVAKMTSDLGIIYNSLGDCEKAYEQNRLACSIMKKVAPNSPDVLKAMIVNGDMLGEMGRYEEAIEVLRGVAYNAEAEGSDKAIAFNSMARFSFSSGKFDDAKKFMRIAQRNYEKEEIDPLLVACGFGHMSALYEDMNDRETAIKFERRVIAISKIPQKILLEATTRLFLLVSLVGKEEEAISYMEDAVERLKDSVGPNHYQVGYCYRKLGAAYVKSAQLELAFKCLTKAKDIMDVTRGPDHLESLETSHSLALTYAFMKRVEPAIEIEEKVVEGLKGLGPLDQVLQEFMDEAVELLKDLNKMKEKMAGPAGPLINVFANLMR